MLDDANQPEAEPHVSSRFWTKADVIQAAPHDLRIRRLGVQVPPGVLLIPGVCRGFLSSPTEFYPA